MITFERKLHFTLLIIFKRNSPSYHQAERKKRESNLEIFTILFSEFCFYGFYRKRLPSAFFIKKRLIHFLKSVKNLHSLLIQCAQENSVRGDRKDTGKEVGRIS